MKLNGSRVCFKLSGGKAKKLTQESSAKYLFISMEIVGTRPPMENCIGITLLEQPGLWLCGLNYSAVALNSERTNRH